tara:strand:- start:723 stop:1007 length:285 start_codon:yes stop_codon:yes gene_type:complete
MGTSNENPNDQCAYTVGLEALREALEVCVDALKLGNNTIDNRVNALRVAGAALATKPAREPVCGRCGELTKNHPHSLCPELYEPAASSEEVDGK